MIDAPMQLRQVCYLWANLENNQSKRESTAFDTAVIVVSALSLASLSLLTFS